VRDGLGMQRAVNCERSFERLGIAVTYLPGAHGGRGSDPQEFAERLHEVLQEA